MTAIIIKGRQIISGGGNNQSSFRNFILSLNPTAYYPMDELTGNTCFDLIANRHGIYPANAVLNQESLLVGNQTSKSVVFPTSTNPIVIPYTFTNTDFTIGGLVKPSLLLKNIIFSVNLSLNGNRAELSALFGTTNHANRGNIFLGLSQNVSFYNPSFAYNVGQSPIFVVMRLSSNILSYFINGVKTIEVSTSGNNGNPPAGTNQIVFGSFPSFVSDNINLSEIFFFNSALTDQVINNINSNRF